MTFAVDRMDHVEVFVRDIEASVKWYQDVLGLTVVRRWDPAPVMIGANETMIALFKARREGPSNGDGDAQPPIRWRRVAWRTSEAGFDEAQRHLAGRKVAFQGPVDHGCAWSIYFNDPDGNPLEITYYFTPDEAPQSDSSKR